MAPPSSSASATDAAAGVQKPNKSIGFVANALKRKDRFIQFFAITGILLLSMRSVGQKYRIHNLHEDNAALEEEQKSLLDRVNRIKSSLLAEAAGDPTGAFAARLHVLFGDNN